MPATESSVKKKNARDLATFFSAWLIAIAIVTPRVPATPNPGLDWSWMRLLQFAFTNHFSFGREVAFTYGPFGFLYAPIWNPSTYLPFLLLWGALCGVWAFIAWRLSPELRDKSKILWLFFFAFFTFLASPHDISWNMQPDGFVFALLAGSAFIFFLPSSPKIFRADAILFAIVWAFLGLVKFNFFLLGAFFWLMLFARLRTLAAAFPLAVIALWLLARQNWLDLPSFISTSWNIASGYGDAMSLEGGPLPLSVYVIAAATLLLFLRRKGSEKSLLSMMTVFFWVLFKTGFVRQDEHQIIAFTALIPIVFFVAFFRRKFPLSPIRLAALALTAPVLFYFGIRYCTTSDPAVWVLKHASLLPERARAFIHPIENQKLLSRESELAASEMQASFKLPPSGKTVDAYFARLNPAFSAGLNYRPRPVCQSFCAYTAALLAQNAAHLRGTSAPDYIFWSLDPLNDRFPNQEDGLSWPEVLANYSVAGEKSKTLLLEKRTYPRQPSFSDPVTKVIALEETLLIPPVFATSPVWARIHLRKTFLGTIMSVLFKLPPVLLWVEETDGLRLPFRLIPENASAGFLVSPAVLTMEDFKILASDPNAPLSDSRHKIRGFSIEADPTFWNAQVEAELSKFSVKSSLPATR